MKSQALRIGLIGSGDDSSSKLLRLLAEQGMQVVHALLPKDLTDAHIAATDLDVWLLDLDDNHWHDQLDELMDRSSVPIFFNEHQAIESQQHLDYWCRNLISRMFELVADVPGLPPVASAPAAANRSGDTVHIAFPASAQKKSESKPSDELTPAPAALDPDLLQEIEELEQLLQTPTKQQEVLPDLDDSLPLPAAQDDFIFTPAAAAQVPPAAPKPVATAATAAAERQAEKPAEKAAEKITEKVAAQTTKTPAETPASTATPAAIADSAAKPLDPVAAAKERAAKIKQQAAANQGKAAPATLTEAAPAFPTPTPTPTPIAATVAVPDTAAKAASIAATAAGNLSATAAATAAAPTTPASSTATPATTPVAGKPLPAQAAPSAPAASTSATAAPEKTSAASQAAAARTQIAASGLVSASTANDQKTPELKFSAPNALEKNGSVQNAPDGKTGSQVTLDIAALEPVVSPPEKHDWPAFPVPPAERSEQQLAMDADSVDFAPIQPQPATGPMREPARPLAVVPGTAAANAKPTSKPGESKPAPETEAAAGHNVAPAAGSYAEPVPTLTPTNMADLEFEAVDFEPAADELEPHGDFDVPMLESVASANASEFEAVTDMPPALPCDLWVLGASLGGPAALKRFFTALDQPLPICFLLAQHIDAHFLPVLGKILEQANPFYAVQVLARPGLIEPGSLLLAPIEKRLRFLDAGQIVHSGKSWTPPYSPCIDDVLSDVAAAYPGQVHAIVFSGMGEDGVDGARAIRDGQGQIWVQEAESCASSVMPDAIHQAGLAHQRATPEQLATRLMARYRQSADSKNLA